MTTPAGLARCLRHPLCVGVHRAAALHRLEQIAFPPTPAERPAQLRLSVLAGLTQPAALAPLATGDVVSREANRHFPNVWDAVAWLRDHHPEIDLDAPYKPRPR